MADIPQNYDIDPEIDGPQKTIISRHLDTVGNGTGTKNANGNYSGAATIFKIQPSGGVNFRIRTLTVFIADNGILDAGSYGDAITLTNGIQVRIQNNSGTIVDITDGVKILTNGNWARLSGFQNRMIDTGTGDDYWVFVISFREKYGQDIRLVGSNNERLEVVLNDNLTGLTQHYFVVQGFQE